MTETNDNVAAVHAQLQARSEADAQQAAASAAAVTLTPELLDGLAQNIEWLLQKAAADLEISDEDDNADGMILPVKTTRKLILNFALVSKGLREFAELLQALDAFRQEKGVAA